LSVSAIADSPNGEQEPKQEEVGGKGEGPKVREGKEGKYQLGDDGSRERGGKVTNVTSG
jgi:hypothetical protein